MIARSYYSKRALAQRYGVHEGTLDRWTREGCFPPPVKIAGAKGICRWPSDLIERFELRSFHAAGADAAGTQ
jgi:predicted DNA-binding transcriptional regulator AlpA